jgi:glycosyltransferase involved in cell wall biosynthesis
MKIAFDGTVLHGRKSGVGYYCEELLKAMLASNHADEFFVFSHLPVSCSGWSSNGNLTVSNSSHFPIRAIYLHALLPRVLDNVEPDVCHYTNFLAPISESRPYVVTIHDMGLDVLRNAHPLAKRLYTRRLIPHVARKARLVLTNSEYSKWEIVRRLGIPEERIRVTPLAASSEFTPGPAKPVSPYFLYVGNLEPRKNLERLIEAFASVPSKEHELWIAGNRWYRGHHVEQKVQAMGLSSRVKLLGYVPRAELPGLFRGAEAFVYPSLLEGFGMPVVEAMACGAPVIASGATALKEVAGDAALLVNPLDTRDLAEAMTRVSQDQGLRQSLSTAGLKRAADFSWSRTATLTLEAYQDALRPPVKRQIWQQPSNDDIEKAIRKTIAYSNLFDYPLTPAELHERLFDVEVDEARLRTVLASMNLAKNPALERLRSEREHMSDEAIRRVEPHLRTLASFPFVRMIAFSGSTAHRNMTSMEDIDLFIVVEDGKLWATFLSAVVWAKIKGLRRTLCMNYLLSDAALPLFETDEFTAQQVASLKPVYGRSIYDRFIAANPFVRRRFPNFDAARHRATRPEISVSPFKGVLERVLRLGPVQLFDRISRVVLGRYLQRKARGASKAEGECAVLLEPRRLKLHLFSHKREVIAKI